MRFRSDRFPIFLRLFYFVQINYFIKLYVSFFFSFRSQTRILLMDAFLQNNRLDHVSRVMSSHPLYLDHFLRTQNFILRGDGPLPYDYRHLIAIMVSKPFFFHFILVLFFFLHFFNFYYLCCFVTSIISCQRGSLTSLCDRRRKYALTL